MRICPVWLATILCVGFPTQVLAVENRWTAGYGAGGFFSEVDGTRGTNLALYCNPWIDARPAGRLIKLPPTVIDAEDRFYEITISFSDGEMNFVMLLTQGQALQFSARGDEKFGALKELAARIKASDGFSASSKDLGWSDDFSSENAGPGIGNLLDCTPPDLN